MNQDEIIAIAAVCYRETAWVVKPRAEQAISLCERFLARLTEQAEPDGWIDGEGDPYCQHGWGKQPPAGWTTCEENAYPVFRHPFPEPAPQQHTSTTPERATEDTPAVGAAPLPEDVREMVSDLHLYAKTGNSPIAKAICLQAANMLERLAEQAAKWQALAELQARLAEVAARRHERDSRLAACAAIPDGYALVPREPTDKELLELAAKAAGIDFSWRGGLPTRFDSKNFIVWNPLEHNGDALWLAVKLRADITFNAEDVFVFPPDGSEGSAELFNVDSDPYAATRRAIVRAAAEIGKAQSCKAEVTPNAKLTGVPATDATKE